jgi:hypothetical protein
MPTDAALILFKDVWERRCPGMTVDRHLLSQRQAALRGVYMTIVSDERQACLK